MLTGVAIMCPIHLLVMSDDWEPPLLRGPLRKIFQTAFGPRVTQHSVVISMNVSKPAKWAVFTPLDQGNNWGFCH